MPVLLEMRKRTLWRINRKMSKVRATEPFELRIEVREVATLKEGIIGKVYPRHDILSAEGDLFGFGEKIVNTTIKHKATDAPNGYVFLWYKLSSIKYIKGKFVSELFVKEL
jgi:hypothetical protein